MFGPWLVRDAASDTAALGLYFIFGSIGGLAWSGFSLGPVTPRLRLLASGSLALGTAVFFSGAAASPAAGNLVLFALGVATAPLITGWGQWFARSTQPYLPLAVAMITSNVLLVLSLAPGLSSLLVQAVLVLLPVVAVYLWPGDVDPEDANLQVVDETSRRNSILALGAFAVVAFFIGGVWYRAFALPSLSSTPLLFVFDEVCYMLAIAALAWWLRRRTSLAPIATLTLSVLGLGLVLTQITANAVPRILLSIGLAGGDYYYWLALWALARYLPPRRVFGWGLAFSLIQIALATLFDMYGVAHGYPREALLASGAAVTMLLLPLVFSSRFHLAPPAHVREALPPAGLTDAEARVFALLARGAGDQDVADELFISRHTVKFHVRNILRKCGVPNRKVLLSRMHFEAGEGRGSGAGARN